MARKKQRIEKHIKVGPPTMHPVMTKIPILQKIFYFSANQVRAPVLLSSCCSSWRETIVDCGTGQICWQKMMQSCTTEGSEKSTTEKTGKSKVNDDDDEEEENSNRLHHHHHDLLHQQLRILFYQACVGGRVRVYCRPVCPEPVLWVIQQLLPLRIVSLTSNMIACPDFDVLPHERLKYYKPVKGIQEKWEENFSSTYSFATRRDFLDQEDVEDMEENGEFLEDGDDDYNGDEKNKANIFYSRECGLAPLFYVVVGWQFNELIKMLLQDEYCRQQIGDIESCFSTKGRSLICLAASQAHFNNNRTLFLLLDHFEKQHGTEKTQALINSRDRRGSFPLFEACRLSCETSVLWFRLQHSFIGPLEEKRGLTINLNQQFGGHPFQNRNHLEMTGKDTPLPAGMTLLHFCAKFYGATSSSSSVRATTNSKESNNADNNAYCPWTCSSTNNAGLSLIARYLLEAGADATTIKDAKGKTALDYARENKAYDGAMMKEFRKHFEKNQV